MKHSTSRLWAESLLGFVRLKLGAALEFNRLALSLFTVDLGNLDWYKGETKEDRIDG